MVSPSVQRPAPRPCRHSASRHHRIVHNARPACWACPRALHGVSPRSPRRIHSRVGRFLAATAGWPRARAKPPKRAEKEGRGTGVPELAAAFGKARARHEGLAPRETAHVPQREARAVRGTHAVHARASEGARRGFVQGCAVGRSVGGTGKQRRSGCKVSERVLGARTPRLRGRSTGRARRGGRGRGALTSQRRGRAARRLIRTTSQRGRRGSLRARGAR